MEKPVQWMTLPELRDELERTWSAWEPGLDVYGVLADGNLPRSGQDAQRHQMVADEMVRRPGKADLT